MKNVALLEDSYLFRKLQSDQLLAEGVNVLVYKTADELLEGITTTAFDIILVDRYHADLDYDVVTSKFGLTLKTFGVTCPIALWTNLKPPVQEFVAAGFDLHAPKTLYSKAELLKIIGV